MPRVSVEDYPIISKYWYIVDFRNLLKAKLLPHYYVNRKAAKRAIELNFIRKRWKYYKVMKGYEVKDFMIDYRMGMGLGKFTKYRYDEYKTTQQDKKSHRTQMRRRLRRMNMLTLVNPKKSIKREPDYIKPIKNRQKEGFRKNTLARVLQIERKPDKYFYLVDRRELSRHRGKLFKITGLRFDNTTGEIKKYCLHTLRTDIFTPYLITDLERMVYEQTKKGHQTAEYFRQWGFTFKTP